MDCIPKGVAAIVDADAKFVAAEAVNGAFGGVMVGSGAAGTFAIGDTVATAGGAAAGTGGDKVGGKGLPTIAVVTFPASWAILPILGEVTASTVCGAAGVAGLAIDPADAAPARSRSSYCSFRGKSVSVRRTSAKASSSRCHVSTCAPGRICRTRLVF